MAVVKGVKEKVHLPLYDAVTVKPGRRLGEVLSSNVLRFFQDVTGKTKLQTNMQASSLLPHWNTYEAHSLRVVISDLSPVVADSPTVTREFDLFRPYASAADKETESDRKDAEMNMNLKGTVTFSLRNLVDLKRRIEGPTLYPIRFSKDLQPSEFDLKLAIPMGQQSREKLEGRESFVIDHTVLKEIEAKLVQAGAIIPPTEQIFPNDGFGALIGKLIYNTVTTFFVGEKIMIQVPTWFFPAGAGPYSENGRVTTHGFPTPQATFRFAEPVTIDAQQNFRVELEIPESDVLSDLQRIYGPFFIWVTLDGYMTRDVQ